MGVVWRAEDRVIGRQVALKELRAPVGAGSGERATYLERVLREARTAGRLSDPAVVTVYDVLTEQDVTYIVMELVSAPTLAELMAREGPLEAARVADIGVQVLGALETAHAAGIVHRDVKPSNIMVLPNGRVKLADFGIARAMDDPSLTMTGGIMGSPGYMAPELFAGAGPAPASDLWSLGATLFHAAEGHAPFRRDSTAATVHAIMYEQPRVQRCQGKLAAVVTGLLTQSTRDRLTAAQAGPLLADVTSRDSTGAVSADDAPTRYVGNTTTVVPSDPSPAPWHDSADDGDSGSTPKRRRGLLLLAGTAVAVVVALGVVFLLPPDAERTTVAAANTGESGAVPIPEPGETTDTTANPGDPTTASLPPSGDVAARAHLDPSGGPGETDVTGRAGGGGEDTEAGSEPGERAPETQQNAPERELLPLTRYNHPKGPHFSGTSNVDVPEGFSPEGVFGSLAAAAEPGAKKLYACTLSDRDGDWFSSIDQSGNCEGQQAVGLLGYIFDTVPEAVSSRPLYRCNAGDSHFDSLSSGCEGEARELLLGHLITG